MIKRKGDLFATEQKFIGHGVNCQGVMGAGIAVTVKNNFPETHKDYRDYCKRLGGLALGGYHAFEENDKIIFNLFTQHKTGRDARYESVHDALYCAAGDIVGHCKETGDVPVLAIPLIGCGIGGLEWDKVECLLKAIEILTPGFEFEVWKYE
jgi:O-acetyl-ADP-ribose deacetylase (regulator of RNase III)